MQSKAEREEGWDRWRGVQEMKENENYPRGADRAVSLWGGVFLISVPLTAGLLPKDLTRSRNSCISESKSGKK